MLGGRIQKKIFYICGWKEAAGRGVEGGGCNKKKRLCRRLGY